MILILLNSLPGRVEGAVGVVARGGGGRGGGVGGVQEVVVVQLALLAWEK